MSEKERRVGEKGMEERAARTYDSRRLDRHHRRHHLLICLQIIINTPGAYHGKCVSYLKVLPRRVYILTHVHTVRTYVQRDHEKSLIPTRSDIRNRLAVTIIIPPYKTSYEFIYVKRWLMLMNLIIFFLNLLAFDVGPITTGSTVEQKKKKYFTHPSEFNRWRINRR